MSLEPAAEPKAAPGARLRLATQAANALFRATPLVFKYLFSLAVIRCYSLEFVGAYNLITGACALLVYLAGMEFYYYANRATCRLAPEERGRLLVSQFAMYAVTHLAIALPVFLFFQLRFRIGLLVVGVLVGQHFNLELYRVLCSLKRPLTGSLVASLGTGYWCIPLLAAMAMGHPPTLQVILLTSLCFFLGSVAIGLGVVHREVNLLRPGLRIDRTALRSGLMVSLPILVSTMAYRGSELLGRFWLAGRVALAASGMFSSVQILASTTLVLVESSVSVIALPFLVESRQADLGRYLELRRRVRLQFLVLTSVFAAASVALFKPAMRIMGAAHLDGQLGLFAVMGLAYAFLAIASFYSLELYAANRDRQVISVNLAASVVNAGLSYLFINHLRLGIRGAALSIAAWAFIQLLAKGILARRALAADLRRAPLPR